VSDLAAAYLAGLATGPIVLAVLLHGLADGAALFGGPASDVAIGRATGRVFLAIGLMFAAASVLVRVTHG
jgi:hypothetical protein